ncbi:Fision threonyl-tRNA synthetase, partial [human gut metagenome]
EKIVKDIAICKLNGRNYELNEVIEEEGDISLIGFDSELGMKIYTRTLPFYMFVKA